jgi:hypothetical protein
MTKKKEMMMRKEQKDEKRKDEKRKDERKDDDEHKAQNS